MFGWLVLAVTVGMCLLVASIRRGDLGRRMLAVRSNERAAAAAAVNVRNVKLIAFGISAFIAGVAGSLYAYNFGSVSAARFNAVTALALIAFAYAASRSSPVRSSPASSPPRRWSRTRSTSGSGSRATGSCSSAGCC